MGTRGFGEPVGCLISEVDSAAESDAIDDADGVGCSEYGKGSVFGRAREFVEVCVVGNDGGKGSVTGRAKDSVNDCVVCGNGGNGSVLGSARDSVSDLSDGGGGSVYGRANESVTDFVESGGTLVKELSLEMPPTGPL